MTSLETRWREMSAHPEGSAFQRIDDSHPLDFYLGRESSGEWVLLLITDECKASSREHHAIHIICRQRADGRWALLFRLMKPELGKLYSLVCEDLVESSRSNPDPSHPASFVLTRFARWQRLLERGHTGLLDDTSLRGLMGELLFLKTVMIPSRGEGEAINGWIGPCGADRDFRFPDHEYEVKTIRDGANRVLISSAEQLDLPTKLLDLVIVVMDDATPGSLPEALTPLDLVSELRHRLATDPISLDAFEAKLIDAGFVTRDEYGERAFILQRIRMFRVGEEFPAIRRSLLPAGIGKVSWELLIQEILAFEIPTTT
jgi:hypothetical protein